ncbi:MAG: hypothetical protein Q4F81_08400 [Eubacteriales bacterium]|nr:hypothetical protein [Eubacteriales bacterium]
MLKIVWNINGIIRGMPVAHIKAARRQSLVKGSTFSLKTAVEAAFRRMTGMRADQFTKECLVRMEMTV